MRNLVVGFGWHIFHVRIAVYSVRPSNEIETARDMTHR